VVVLAVLLNPLVVLAVQLLLLVVLVVLKAVPMLPLLHQQVRLVALLLLAVRAPVLVLLLPVLAPAKSSQPSWIAMRRTQQPPPLGQASHLAAPALRPT